MQHVLFDGVRDRMARAFQLVQEFEDACSNWERGVKVSLVHSRDQGWHVWSTAPISNPRADLAIRAGEIVHHLRSSLDLGATAAIKANGEEPGKRASFPIALTEQTWKSQGEEYLRGAASSVIAYVEKVQPVNTKKAHGPRGDSLALVAEVDAADKHRQLLAQGVALQTFDLNIHWESTSQVMRHFRQEFNDSHFMRLDTSTWFTRWFVSRDSERGVPDESGTPTLDSDYSIKTELRFTTQSPYKIDFEKSRLRTWAQYVGGVLYQLEKEVARPGR